MDKNVMDILGGIISVIMGLGLIIYHKSLGTKTAYYQQRFWDLFHFRTSFSEGTINAIQIMFLIIGISFIIFGLLTVFQVIRFK